MRQKLFIILGMLLAGMLLFSQTLFSQTRKPDFSLTGRYDGGKVYLKWVGLPADSVRMNYIYRSITGSMSPTVRLDSTTKFEYVDQSQAAASLNLPPLSLTQAQAL